MQLLLFVDSQDSSGDYIDRMRLLKSKKLLPADFQEPAEFAAHRGTAGGCPGSCPGDSGGGVTDGNWLAAQPRYAESSQKWFTRVSFRRAVRAGRAIFRGLQFLGIIGRAEDFQRDSIQGTAVLTTDDARQRPAQCGSADQDSLERRLHMFMQGSRISRQLWRLWRFSFDDR